MSTLGTQIKTAWENLQIKVEEERALVSSEKTLVFSFAMELAQLYNCKDISFDFEFQAYNSIDNTDKYLDLLIYENSAPHSKYAIEFKAPMRSAKGNSNQTETRKKIYKDIARLKYLLENSSDIVGAYFFMITDEAPYFNSSNSRNNTFDTSNKHQDSLEEFLTSYNISNFNFIFRWKNIADSKIKGKFAWLEPIIITDTQTKQSHVP